MRTKFEEFPVRYLEMIQAVVTRMGTNSFALKGWALTIVAAILAFAGKKYISVALVPVLMFWILDAFYLRLERQYRALFDLIRMDDNAAIDFELKPKIFMQRISTVDRRKLGYIACFFSATETLFYVPVGIIVLLFLTKVI